MTYNLSSGRLNPTHTHTHSTQVTRGPENNQPNLQTLVYKNNKNAAKVKNWRLLTVQQHKVKFLASQIIGCLSGWVGDVYFFFT